MIARGSITQLNTRVPVYMQANDGGGHVLELHVVIERAPPVALLQPIKMICKIN